MSNTSLYQAMENRRSCYGISAHSPISDERILELVGHAVTHVPSAFNSQSARVAVLLGQQHKRLWNDITAGALKKVTPADSFAQTSEKLGSFAAGYGTVLFFDHTPTTEALMAQFSLYRDNFPVWAQQANGMLQYAVWMSLECEGLGASLQHYSPLIDEAVYEVFDIDRSWKLIAQMPFGTPTAQPQPKEFMPLDARIRVLR
ncbi:MAG: nitroreductase family protein [Acetanaerobacterium sp.]